VRITKDPDKGRQISRNPPEEWKRAEAPGLAIIDKDLFDAAQRRSQLGQLQRSIDRLWADYESERVPVDIAGPKLKDMQDQKVALRAELAEQPGLHPSPSSRASLRRARHPPSERFGEGVTPDTQEAAERILI
jgi:Recombinase